MTEPRHDFRYRLDLPPLGQRRPADHDHRQFQFARRVDLGARAFAAGVAGDDPCDAPDAYQIQFAGERERPAREDQLGIRKRQWISCRVDEAERVGVLRLGCEWRDVLPADGEKNIGTRLRQRSHSRIDIIHVDPAIARLFGPRLAFQRKQRRCRCGAGGECIAADFGCEGMGRIDHMREFFPPDDVGKPVRTAEAANARRQRLIDRDLRPAGIGIDRVEPCGGDFSRQPIGFARSAQDEDAHA